jgi:hypothetical protein
VNVCDQLLKPFWIPLTNPYGPLGIGVTAWSFSDALRIVRALGYDRYLPDDLESLRVVEGVTVGELHHHVAQNMGPIVVRGMWYPFIMIGVPQGMGA